MKIYSALIISSFIFFGLTSCDDNCPHKGSESCISPEGSPTGAIIMVKDQNGNPLNGVTVRAYHIVANSVLNDPAKSGAWTKDTQNGLAELDFSTLYRRGQSNVATVFLEVTDASGTVLGFVNANDQKLDLKMEQNVQHTVTMQ